MVVYAQRLENPLLEENIRNMEGADFAARALPFVIHWLLLVGFLAFLVYFILGAIKWITGRGEKNSVEEAQKQLTNAFIGLFIIFSIFAIIKIVGRVFGISGLEGLQISLPTL